MEITLKQATKEIKGFKIVPINKCKLKDKNESKQCNVP